MTTRVAPPGSFDATEITYLLDPVPSDVVELPTATREAAMRAGRHYGEMLPVERVPSTAYLAAVDAVVDHLAAATAELVGRVGHQLAAIGRPFVLASIARGGCPAGILLRRHLRQVEGRDIPHVAVSVVKGRGLDPVAARRLAAMHPGAEVVFVDGWTGKGGIADELAGEPGRLVVLADPAGRADVAGTCDDELIPTACLNALSHGMVSRTMLSPARGQALDRARFYPPSPLDRSRHIVDAVSARLGPPAGRAAVASPARQRAADVAVAEIAARDAAGDRGRVRPGIGEALRVLLRREPQVLVVRDADDEQVRPVLVLAAESAVPTEVRPALPWRALAITAAGR